MKKTLSILLFAVLAVLFAQSCGKYDEQIDGLFDRVDAIENGKCVSLSEQIAGINASIADLAGLKEEIQALTAYSDSLGLSADALKAADESLTERINALQAYADGELGKYADKDIIAATYATLAQYNATVRAIAGLEERIGGLDGRLADSISEISESLADWTGRLEDALLALTGRVEALEQRIQTVTLIPAYSDGSLKTKDGVLSVNCIIKPAAAVGSLTKDNFSLQLNRIHRHTTGMSSLRVVEDKYFEKDTLRGTVSMKVDVSAFTPSVGDTLTVAVNVKTDISDLTTKFARVAFATPSVGGDFNAASAVFHASDTDSYWELKLGTEGTEFPKLRIVTNSAYSKDFIEGNFGLSRAVYTTSATDSTVYTMGSMTVTRAAADNCYDFVGTASDENFAEFNFKSSNVSVSARRADGGTPITLQDKAADDPARIAVSGITLNSDSADIQLNGTVSLVATVFPAAATNANVVWSSSDKNVASVDADGLVTGVSVGTATVTATTVDGGRTAECNVIVRAVSVTGVILDKTDEEIYETESMQLTATIYPADATNRKVTWSSSDNTVAAVDGNGKVTGVTAGTATITVTTVGGKKTASCTVRVKHLIMEESVSVEPETVNMGIGDKRQLTASILPADASMKNVEWTSDDPDVASVDENGLVTGKSLGSATITATTAHGRTDICTVTVQLPTGALTGKFSVSPTKKVHFSKGNLLVTIDRALNYKNWRFHEHQYDYLRSTPLQNAFYLGGDVDLFRWSTTARYSNWGLHENRTVSKEGSGANDYLNDEFKDWGKAIDDNDTWRTLSADEWEYLLNGRENAAQKVGRAMVCNVEGIVLLPDEFTGPGAFVSGVGQPHGYDNNEYDEAGWQAMEQAGAVFLPVSSNYYYLGNVYSRNAGHYWTSTVIPASTVFYRAGQFEFGERYASVDTDDGSVFAYCTNAYAVRLVTESK